MTLIFCEEETIEVYNRWNYFRIIKEHWEGENKKEKKRKERKGKGLIKEGKNENKTWEEKCDKSVDGMENTT